MAAVKITKKRKKEPQRHKEHKDFLTHNFLVGTILQKHRASGCPLGDRYRKPRTRMASWKITR
ncbi:MAG: hypothetical protein EWV53_06435 [Microcystis panniformis Mp_MB_F_20051200_S9]|jgi:hypothetical protein|uniref:Uncharacterized protein n=1 Tax=Microcystis panniformis Mp_MB_F_20051200_S9 TaxID=2486223 RepID=A0A552Q5I7_9CHRO|nr:MAG: hypothetical protein EWV87_14355 [Microcystis panniformis Mp_GB_SS_20050300_S99]TRV47674.1 MAG: hypothetical protein EWV43_12155 [Microcystis panniformis Mp_MB_F_20080800_S26D]TRV52356.1 MAG: hypothetical protein EWV42_08155 [Microcystis panniformis Mp_GB_SS_20050300_S99D]TRV56499.1 MAG: hypothetical protein EWV69_17895 [Microcystis panniformis Mp_MB_F_20080800_S26]TRV56897.1 MAG: hypothetical protein EWV86_21920 [Microcystis panniformis Mp_MB_F_20051200_S9D]TRV64497.1 MAG: hypothetica